MFYSVNPYYVLLVLVFSVWNCLKVSGAAPDDMPIVQVRLAPPAHPFPEISARIGALTHLREQTEVDNFHEVQRAFDVSLDRAKAQIGELVKRTMHPYSNIQILESRKSHVSFLQTRIAKKDAAAMDDGFQIKLSLSAAAPPDPLIQGLIEKIENKRSTAENNMFQQACKEMEALTDIILNELGSQIHANVIGLQHATDMATRVLQPKQINFMQTFRQKTGVVSSGLPKQANVRVSASKGGFPHVSDLVEEMEIKRNSVEALERSEILEMQLKLMQTENEIIKSALNVAINPLLAM